MIPLDRAKASSSLPSRRITVRSSSVDGLNTLPETLDPTRKRSSSVSLASKRSSSSSSASKRRSVSSMKGLMPLTLSPSCSTSSSPSLVEERMANKVDGYFPEVLARDLELSNSVFASRNMTSGLPDPGLSPVGKGRFIGTPGPHRFATATYHGSPGLVRSLGPIQERSSDVSNLDHQYTNYDDTSTDPESLSGTEISRGPVAPSMSFRERSIKTAATSLRSSNWIPSPKDSPPCDLVPEHSWIEPDSDDDEQDPCDSPNEDNLANLSPRPPTPPDSDNETEAAGREQGSSSRYNRILHLKSHSLSGTTVVSPPPRRQSGRWSESGAQRPAWSPTEPVHPIYSPTIRRHTDPPSDHRPRATSLQTFHNHIHRFPSARSRASHLLWFPSERRPRTEPALSDAGLVADEANPVPHKRSFTKPISIQSSPPSSPLVPRVQSWLNGSTSPYTSQFPGDDLAKAVPLPPDVVETLRVSIACFPETMLLTSSLTVETIRNYSKKLRHPGADMMNNLVADSMGGSPRKSLWKRVVAYKRGSFPNSATPGSNLKSSSSASLEAPKSWAPLKNVFGCCSDYICDALWAHIVAYHYISALLPRIPARPRRGSVHDSQNEEIPKKAATLLGLAISRDMRANAEHVGRKSTSQLSWVVKDSMVTEQSPRSVVYENTTRDIQAGLMRCIMRLIATAKLMSENGTTEDSVVEMETGEVDVLFTRSLCEIVRMAEDSH